MAKTRRLLTNFSKGELSPKLEGRPDLASYFEGGKTIENWVIMRQGGLDRRPGTRFIAEVKDSTKDTILIPFEVSVDSAYQVEFGHLYVRFYKNKQPIMSGGLPVEIVSPYTEAQLRNVHFTQSVDVLFLFHPDVPQYKLSHISDTDWVLQPIVFSPPPSFEADADISGGTVTLTPGALTGFNVIFLASAPVFIEGDVGRMIVFEASRAIITGLGLSAGDITSPNVAVRANIIDQFFNTSPIAAGSWLLRLSPQASLTLYINGAQVSLTADKNAFRAADFGKYVAILGGLLKIDEYFSPLSVLGTVKSKLSGTTVVSPPAVPPEGWTLEVESWSVERGYPRTGEFFQGRLGQAATKTQPTTWWLSTSDDFVNYAVGSAADRAIEYTIAARRLDRIEWLADRQDLFIGTTGAEIDVTSGRTDQPFGGDVIPSVKRATTHGSAPIQPIIIGVNLLFVDRSQKKLFNILFDLYQNVFNATEATGIAEHIMGTGIRLGPIAYTQSPDPRLYIVRQDGVLVTLTFFEAEKVIGFTRFITDGTFESVSIIPGTPGTSDQVWVTIKRTINGVVKRYVELFEPEHESLTIRTWNSLQTDCALVYNSTATLIVTGLTHLEGKTVDVVADGSYIGTKIVSGGQIVLTEEASEIEIGLHYDSTVVTMRPGITGQVIEGSPRSWDSLWLRLINSFGGRLNDEVIGYPVSSLGLTTLFTGDVKASGIGWDTDGRITVKQNSAYPMTLLAVFGTLSVSEND